MQLFDCWAGSLTPRRLRRPRRAATRGRRSAIVGGRCRASTSAPAPGHLLAELADGRGRRRRRLPDAARRGRRASCPACRCRATSTRALLAAGWEALEAHTRDVVERGRAAPGHVVNLGHGVPPETDPEVLTRLGRAGALAAGRVHPERERLSTRRLTTPSGHRRRRRGGRSQRGPRAGQARRRPAPDRGARRASAGWSSARDLGDVRVDLGAESFAKRSRYTRRCARELGLPTMDPVRALLDLDRTPTAAIAYPIPHGVLGIPRRSTTRTSPASLPRPGSRAPARTSRMGPDVGADADDLAIPRRRPGSGREVLDALVAPVAGGIHSADPADLSSTDVVTPGLRRAAGERGLPDRRGRRPARRRPRRRGRVRRSSAACSASRRPSPTDIDARGGECCTEHGRHPHRPRSATPGTSPSTTPSPVRSPATRRAAARPARRSSGPRCSSSPSTDAPRSTCCVPSRSSGIGDWQLPRGADLLRCRPGPRLPRPGRRPARLGPAASRRRRPARPPPVRPRRSPTTRSSGRGCASVGGHHVLRVSYGRAGVPTPEPTLAETLRDASTLLGVHSTARTVRGTTHRPLRQRRCRPHTPDHRARVAALAPRTPPGCRASASPGAWVAGTGLAAVLPHAAATPTAASPELRWRREDRPRHPRVASSRCTQSGHVADALRALGHDVELRHHHDRRATCTTGSLVDTGRHRASSRPRCARRCWAATVDIAVHSFKDLPTAPSPASPIAAVPPRADPARRAVRPRRAVPWTTSPSGARVGHRLAAPRRAAARAAPRPHAWSTSAATSAPGWPAPWRPGTADLDAVVLAARRPRPARPLGRRHRRPATSCPAPAQGALAVECRADAAELHRRARRARRPRRPASPSTAERAVLAELGAGCAAPIGALCFRRGTRIALSVKVLSADGSRVAGRTLEGTARRGPRRARTPRRPLACCRSGRRRRHAAGGHPAEPPGRLPRRPVPVGAEHRRPSSSDAASCSRAPTAPSRQALRDAGADVTCVPLTRDRPRGLPAAAARRELGGLHLPHGRPRSCSTRASTSPRLGRRASPRWAPRPGASWTRTASGCRCAPARRRSAAEPRSRSSRPAPDASSSPGSARASPTWPTACAPRAGPSRSVATYTTAPARRRPARPRRGLGARRLRRGRPDRRVRRATASGPCSGRRPSATRVVAFGRPSATAAAELGFTVDAVAATQDGPGLVRPDRGLALDPDGHAPRATP